MSKEKSSIGFGLGLLAGVVGGIVAGILYAPCPGSEMRAKVKNTVWKCYSMPDIIVALIVSAIIFVSITAGNWGTAIVKVTAVLCK